MMITNFRPKSLWALPTLACALLSLPLGAQDSGDQLPDPDGKPADMSKPVQVFILMGQSNMVSFGATSGLKAATQKGLYPYLVDDAGNWTVRKDVRNVRVMCSGASPWKLYFNDWLSGSNGSGGGKGKFGPEIGIGYHVGEALDAPVLILKSCIGNRSLGYDLLPPSAVGTGAGGKSYEGNKDDPTRTPKAGKWYAGLQYDGDTRAAKEVLKDLSKYYPGAKRFEVAGFCFWQGAKDLGSAGSADNYEVNLVHFIKDLRKDFNAPNALFVCATMGQAKKGSGGAGGKITDAQLAVDGKTGKYPEFKGNVATFYSNPVSKGGSANGHYGGNAETYMNVGDGMGRAMAELLSKADPGSAVRGLVDESKLDSGLNKVLKFLVDEKLAQADKAIQPYLEEQSGKDPALVTYAEKLDEYLASRVSEVVDDMQAILDSGDLYKLKKTLQNNDKIFAGIADYDETQAVCVEELSTETAIKELAVGDQFYAIVAKKEKLKAASYFGRLATFQEENPDSFYTRQADEEIAALNAMVKKSIDKIEAIGAGGDVYAKFTMIKEEKAKLAKIPAFDEANEEWKQEFKDSETKKIFSAGKAYAAIFEDLDEIDAKLKKIRAKNNKIRSARTKANAVKKASLYYKSKLKSLANKLEKFVDRNIDNYYGKGARNALENYIISERMILKNPLARKGG